MKTSAMKSKEYYIRETVEQVRLIDEAIDALREHSEKDISGRLRDRQKIMELKERRDQATLLLSRLHESCEDCWDEVRRDAERLFRPGKKKVAKAA